MTGTNRADAVSAWRDRARYDRLLDFDRATWAWEWLRRTLDPEPGLPRRASWTMLRARPPLCVLTLGRRACGCVLPLGPLSGLADFAGHVCWCADPIGPVLTVDARSARRGAADLFDLHALHHPAIVLRHREGGEHVLIADGPRCIRITVRKGTLLAGPVQLDYHLSGGGPLDTRILTLRRLTALRRLGRFPRTLFPPERRARRWAMALQAWDGRRAGASHREIACVLHGDVLVREQWLGRSDHLRTHIKRLLRTADMLIGGGWRHLLR
ncbi:DUF2285 domain-containing protein [Sphingomonadaceae bacterium jetA1]|uniref:DUF2285 domain-containing protein n=1 Tax=Facivitalis istanbulensis TaxID=3075838 RepID=UPI00348EE2EE